MRLFYLCFFLFSCLSCLTIDVKEEVETGLRQYENDSLNEAIIKFSSVIEKTDTCKDCYLYRSFAYKRLKEYDKALLDLDALINIDTTIALGYANRASVHYLKNDYKSALNDFSFAYKLDSDNVLLNPISHMLFINGYKDSACIFYEKSLLIGDTIFNEEIKLYCDNEQTVEGDLYFKLIDFHRMYDAPDSVLTKIETTVRTVKVDTLPEKDKRYYWLMKFMIDNNLLRKPFIRLRLDNGEIKMLFLDTSDYKQFEQFYYNDLIRDNKKIRVKARVNELHYDSLTAFNSTKLISIEKREGKTYWKK